ncbi:MULTISPECIES: CobW family GTP-binding protein [Enterococcus]|uniref:Cobalamin synthesis protein n=1 Tax=Candidatus Enterococcus ferrettii TaxID=2815324 RepID=A0ABV0EU01_9ENTE|nr:GTP-binding protein [Enterococcus sp. 665A]MBO1341061.1 GTP-binding protein [Enterococcus sp. 665A]
MGIPITIISGFLGSGKTTLINQVLKGTNLASEEIVIIENEFGETGIDHELLLHSQERIFQMNGGCICCSLRTDLINALSAVLEVFVDQGYPIKQIIIETSGISDPQPIMQTIVATPGICSHFYLDSVITVVDSDQFERNFLYPEALKQLAIADRIFISEKSETDASKIPKVVQEIETMNPLTDFHTFSLSMKESLLAAQVLGIARFHQQLQSDKTEEHAHHAHKEHHHQELRHNFEALKLQGQAEIPEKLLVRWIDWLLLNNPDNIFRIKGFVQLAENDYLTEIQGVNQVIQFNPTNRKAKDKVNEIVIIGKNLDQKTIGKAFNKIQRI